ncbi:MAG: Co2+/Mg2+ efflux protein ApaG [Mariprofundus sp.]|nr:Co2+/Mg2+ efflux protein ApaG [Mariprofundus sp.]
MDDIDESGGIIIEVKPEYSSEHSEPEQGRFVFVYYITIRNEGEQAAQLLSRHWLITDGNGMVEEVMGEGVIGEQPVIGAGDMHQYNSFCVLQTNVGYMEGSYRMLSEQGEIFDAPIPAFTLAVPGALN